MIEMEKLKRERYEAQENLRRIKRKPAARALAHLSEIHEAGKKSGLGMDPNFRFWGGT
jgi:hypothetical protein